jgi:hypothetical protein
MDNFLKLALMENEESYKKVLSKKEMFLKELDRIQSNLENDIQTWVNREVSNEK